MSFWKKLFGRKKEDEIKEIADTVKKARETLSRQRELEIEFLDLRSDEERQIEREAYAGVSLGPEVDALVAELIEIGRNEDFLSMQTGGNFNEYGKHIRTREIGARLNEMGGIRLMQAAWYRVRAILGAGHGRSLEVAWGNIGDWQS